MNVSIRDLPASVIATYEEIARARGVSLHELLRESLIRNAPAEPPVQMMTAEAWERALDDTLDSFSADGNPLPDEALSRENIYGREDKW